MGKDCALDQVELEMLCREFSDEALEFQADPKRDQPMRNTTLYYMYCTAVFFALGRNGIHPLRVIWLRLNARQRAAAMHE